MAEDKELTVKVEAIETPRGLVPSISAIESLVEVMNSLLGEMLSLFKDIKRELVAIRSAISDINLGLKSMSVMVSNIYEKVLELSVNFESASDKSADVDSNDEKVESLDSIKKSLKDLLK